MDLVSMYIYIHLMTVLIHMLNPVLHILYLFTEALSLSKPRQSPYLIGAQEEAGRNLALIVINWDPRLLLLAAANHAVCLSKFGHLSGVHSVMDYFGASHSL